MQDVLRLSRWLYNGALQERRDAYRTRGVSITAAQQAKHIPEIKRNDAEYAKLHSHLMQDVITRVDRAFDGFFRRVKAGQTPGYPRFKGAGQYQSFVFKDAASGNGAKLVAGGKRVQLSGIGKVKIKAHRAVEGVVKTIGATLDGDGHWYVVISCDNVPQRTLEQITQQSGKSVGIDVGLSSFIATSEGSFVENPRPLATVQRELARAQRKVSGRKKGSKRRRKARKLLAKKHAKVRNVRKDFHHKTALRLVEQFDVIAVEKLNIKGMSRGILARSIHDAAWGTFLTILSVKAESAGRTLIAVNPRGSSQLCSACDKEVRKALSVRTHQCPHCNLVLDRDVNAARNILDRALHPERVVQNKAGARPSGRRRTAVTPRKLRSSSSPVDPRSPFLARPASR